MLKQSGRLAEFLQADDPRAAIAVLNDAHLKSEFRDFVRENRRFTSQSPLREHEMVAAIIILREGLMEQLCHEMSHPSPSDKLKGKPASTQPASGDHDPVTIRKWAEWLSAGGSDAYRHMFEDMMYATILSELGRGDKAAGAQKVLDCKNGNGSLLLLVGANSKEQEQWRRDHCPQELVHGINDVLWFETRHLLDYDGLYHKAAGLVSKRVQAQLGADRSENYLG